MDGAAILINLIEEIDGPATGNELRGLLRDAREASNAQVWEDAIKAFRTRYRAWVKQQMRHFIPPPVLALPGVRPLVDQLVDRALDEGESSIADAAKEISLGPASAEIGLPPVMLPAPPGLGLPPSLIGFLPPTGLALSFGGGPASGGGSLDYQRKPVPRLAGSLGLKLGIVQVAALSILEESSAGYSLMTLLKGRFAPGIQLGFGFAISGMGGLIGINRGVDAAAVEASFRSGKLVNALFGDDPIGNALTTLNTLGAVFPARPDAHVVGPSVQISWLKVSTYSLFNVDLGVFMQLPGPSRVDVIGSARAAIPLVFQLRMDVRGELDFARRIIAMHAVIVDSHLMGVFKLQGEALFRMRYGDDPYAVLTIGGFFPGFNPAPAELPPGIQRVGLGLDLPDVIPVTLRAEGYLAVTPNTLQFGAHLQAALDAGVFSAEGHFDLDALIQFDPFAFDVAFSAGFHIEVLGESFQGVRCSGRITGPGPIVIHAHLTYETPFFLPDIDWSDTFTIGRRAERLASSVNLFDEMKRELVAENLRAENGDDPHVAIRLKRRQPGELTVLSPFGNLVFVQRRAPLNMELQRLQNTPLVRAQGVRVSAPGQSGDLPRERFNLGMYRDLTDAERLNLNAQAADVVAGVRVRPGMETGPARSFQPGFDDIWRPEQPHNNSGIIIILSRGLLTKVSTRSNPAEVVNTEPRVKLRHETWQAGAQSFDTQMAAHIAAKKAGQLAHLTFDAVNVGGI